MPCAKYIMQLDIAYGMYPYHKFQQAIQSQWNVYWRMFHHVRTISKANSWKASKRSWRHQSHQIQYRPNNQSMLFGECIAKRKCNIFFFIKWLYMLFYNSSTIERILTRFKGFYWNWILNREISRCCFYCIILFHSLKYFKPFFFSFLSPSPSLYLSAFSVSESAEWRTKGRLIWTRSRSASISFKVAC